MMLAPLSNNPMGIDAPANRWIDSINADGIIVSQPRVRIVRALATAIKGALVNAGKILPMMPPREKPRRNDGS